MKKLKHFFRKLIREEQGLGVVLVTLAMTALMGTAALVTDFGLIALTKNRLANAVDAAALAGVQELPENPDLALLLAKEYGLKNGLTEAQMEIDLIPDVATSKKIGVRVTAKKNVEYIMAKALGFDNIDVQEKATARVTPVTSAYGSVPLFIPDTQPLVYGQQYTLRSKDSDYGPGNFGALDFGSGGNTFEKTLADGFEGSIKVDYEIGALTGVIKQKTVTGITARIEGCFHGCTYDHFEPGCSRIMILPVVHYDILNGHKPVTVLGFAAFLVDDVQDSGTIDITGRFVKTLMEGEGSLTQTDYGLRTAKLVE